MDSDTEDFDDADIALALQQINWPQVASSKFGEASVDTEDQKAKSEDVATSAASVDTGNWMIKLEGVAESSPESSGGPSQIVDAFLNWVYEHLAEPLAEATPSDDNPYLAREVDLPDEPLPADEIEEKDLAEFCATIAGLTPACDKEQKWLAPTTMKELYDLMATWQGKQHVPSFTTFICVYKRLWKKTLKIREIGQHARCARCAELSAWLVGVIRMAPFLCASHARHFVASIGLSARPN